MVAAKAQARLPDEPGTSLGVTLIDISKNGPSYSSAFPNLAVSPKDDQTIAIAWRVYSLPINTNAPKGSRTAECHVSISTDSGKTFRDSNVMDVLRTARVDAANPELWYCNAPWVTFGPNGTVYTGGALYTANGLTGPEPKQGRAMVAKSTDNGATWKKGISGITIARLAPGLNGLENGRNPEDTPWDGAMGVADPQNGTVYSIAGLYVSASDDKAESFGTVYQPGAEGWTRQNGGSFTAASGTLAVATFMKSTPIDGTKCPCLAMGLSADKGAHWNFVLVKGAQADDVSPTGRVRYPVIASDRNRQGHFAIATTSSDKRTLKIFFTEDNGQTWSLASPKALPTGSLPITAVDMPGVGYTSNGEIVAAWRGFRSAGAYDVYAGMITSGSFGPTLKLSDEGSPYPPLVQLGNYSLGGGDFTTWVSGNKDSAFVVFPYSPGGLTQKTTCARIELARMR
jgi:hypothetical protein